ncbi:MAG: response regulator [Polyangiaceae bacterium]
MTDAMRVLLVDDNETNLDVLGRRLERKGCSVAAKTSGPLALELLAHERFDIVVLDLRMPEMTGIEVLERIRATHSQVELPVIMATAETNPEDMVRALEAGANDYVTKPIDANVLFARMRAQLRSRTVRSAPASAPDTAASAPPRPSAPPHPAAPVFGGTISIGAVLLGRYRVDSLLGSGGFGSVYRVRHLRLDGDFALKVLHPHLVGSETIRKRFEQEGVSACRVRHPNAVQVTDAGTTEAGLPFIAMELLSGPTLQEAIERSGPFRLKRAVEIITPVCEVLEEAHRVGILHRDVKPANVVLSRGPLGEVVKVLDFGIAKFIDREKQLGLTGEGVSGTPLYMSPEALLGREAGAPSDVFSVGVTLYLMLAGEPPHGPAAKSPFEQAVRQLHNEPTPISVRRPDLPVEVTQAIMSTLARQPENRLTLRELRETLREWAEIFDEPVWPLTGVSSLALLHEAPTAHAEPPSDERRAPEDSGLGPIAGAVPRPEDSATIADPSRLGMRKPQSG